MLPSDIVLNAHDRRDGAPEGAKVAGLKSLPRRRLMRTAGALAACALGPTLAGCTSVPDGIEPVGGFSLDRYLGRWYEIARLDHRFERGLSHVTAEYARHPQGGVQVLNRGWSAEDREWKEAEGRAKFVETSSLGHLKVSFFGPFYGAYVVFELDPDYRYAFVCGPSRDYLWLLARDPVIEPALYRRFTERSRSLGFATEALIRVQQTQRPAG